MGRGLRDVVVSTRTFAAACTLAERLGASAVRFEEVHERLGAADLVVSSTSAPHPVLAADVVRRAVAGRTRDAAAADRPGGAAGHRARGALDRGLRAARPRRPEGRGGPQRGPAPAGGRRRRGDLRGPAPSSSASGRPRASWCPSIVRLREHGEQLAAEEVARAAAGWPALDDDERARLEKLGRAIARRLLHEPTVRLREGAAASDGVAYAETVRDLFGLELPNGTPTPDA